MNIPKKSFIPDRETFQQNQAGSFTPSQMEFFSISTGDDPQVYQTLEKFVFFPEDDYYGFENSAVTFSESQTAFACRDGQLLPGLLYRVCYRKDRKGTEIFLSAEAAQTPTKEIVYPALLTPLQKILNFSDADLHLNQKMRLSAGQIRNLKEKKKVSAENRVGTHDFIYMGDQTLEHAPETKFMDEVGNFFSYYDGVFLLNVKYRIYYELNTERFLSIEPIEILEPDLSRPYFRMQKISGRQVSGDPDPFPIIMHTVLGGTITIVLLFIAIPIVFFTMGMWTLVNYKYGWVLSVFIGWFGLWLWYLIASSSWKNFMAMLSQLKSKTNI